MKKLVKYTTILFLAFLTLSCEKAPIDNPSTGIGLVPPLGYITFNTDVATKAEIVNSLKGKSFGVYGFSYSNSTDWETTRSVSFPDVFQNMVVHCDPETGVPSYDLDSDIAGKQLTPWNLLKYYAFFAYYPYGNGNVVGSEMKNDVPTVTYTLPLGENPVNPDNLVDLMTAHSIDRDPVKNAVVGFNEPYFDGTPACEFQHRLFCLEVMSQNFNDNKDERIRTPKLIIDNLKYNKIIVPLQKGDSKFSVTAQERPSSGSLTFDISGNNGGAGGSGEEEILVYAQNSEYYTGPVSLSGTRNLMLIPQDRLSGQITFELYDATQNKWTAYTQNFESKITFEEGKKYTLSINFTGDSIVIVLSEAGSWEPFQVNYEFA